MKTPNEKIEYFFKKMEEFGIEFHDYQEDVEQVLSDITN